jgi:hypothetical protein
MWRVWLGAAVGALIGIVVFACSRPHGSSEMALVFVVTVTPLTALGAIIGGVHAILQELRALRRQRAMDIVDMETDGGHESSTGIKNL